MNRKTSLLGSMLLALASTTASASGAAGSGPSPYTDRGIGGALFPDTSWAAVTSNVTWDVGSTAITSATASPETCNAKKVAVAEFINHSYANLINETAKGEGEYVTTMLNIYGCDADARQGIVNTMRSQTGAAVNSDDYSSQDHMQKITTFYHIVDNAVSKEASCQA